MREKDKYVYLDIRPPDRKKAASRAFFRRAEAEPAPKITFRERPKKNKYLRIFTAVTLAALTLAITFSAIGYIDLKKSVATSAPVIYEKLREAKEALTNLETAKAKDSFADIGIEVAGLQDRAERYGLLKISELWKSTLPKLNAVPETFRSLARLSQAGFEFAADMEELKENGFRWLTHQKGGHLVANLKDLKEGVNDILSISAFFKNQGVEIGYPLSSDFLGLNANLYQAQRFLDALISFLDNDEEKRLLILFQNPSELRPAGGFLGSYAEIAINKNGLQEITVWDVYDPDGQLETQIIPPRELQEITPRWGARDGNWFFDFPVSAQKVLSLLEQSKIYRERGAEFHGAIAVNIGVLSTILDVVGPIELPEYNLTLDGRNVLEEVQREVESGRDNRAGEPKRILKILMPIIFQELSALSGEEKLTMFKSLENHFSSKDIIFYFKDIEMENFVENLGLAGGILALPQGFSGDYLAVVSANIGGGKSDAYVSQKIKISSKIDTEGRVNNFLVVEKRHDGDRAKDKWHRVPNSSYMKIFTPRGSRLVYLSGNEKKTLKPLIDYGAGGYLTDPDLDAVEGTIKAIPEFGAEQLEESDKTVFGAWFKVARGETKKLELEYWNPNRLVLNGKPSTYRFVFEKQSGAKTALDFLIEAPPGYVFFENNQSAFNYFTDSPMARETIDLTLVPDLPANQR